MKIFLDTEFMDDGKTIELYSVGMVREDGHYFYAELKDADYGKADKWVRDHVLQHLDPVGPRLTHEQMRMGLSGFVGKNPEFWGYYCAYDWVTICQLFGGMMQLPQSWPKYCMDVKQLAMEVGNPELPSSGGIVHHALEDARWTKQVYEYLLDKIKTVEQKVEKSQDALMYIDPAYGLTKPYPSHAAQYRKYHGKLAWLYNPWTGDRRHPSDIGSDVIGLLITAPEKEKAGK